MSRYIGARYVPKFMGTHDITQEYENMCVVDNGSGTSYISKQTVPVGTPLTNTTYWAVYGAASGAVIHLQDQIDDIVNAVTTPEFHGAVGDGVNDDTAALQTALNNASIVVCKNSYKITGQIMLPVGVSIIGKGNIIIDNGFYDAILCNGNNKIVGIKFTETAGTFSPTNNAIITASNTSGLVVENCIFENIYSAYCICFIKSTDISVKYNNIDHYGYGGIMLLNGCERADISFNRVYDGRDTSTSNRYPISISGYLTVADRPAKDIHVLNNYIEDVTPLWEGIDSHSCENCEIIGNVIINTAYGIFLTSPTTPVLSSGYSLKNVIVKNNTIRTTPAVSMANGIIASLGANARGIIESLVIENNDIEVLNNTLHSSIVAGIGIRTTSKNVRIINNKVVNNGPGIFIVDNVTNAYIACNDLSGGAAAADYEINCNDVTDAVNMVIENNYIHDCIRPFTGPSGSINDLIKYMNNNDSGFYVNETYTTAARSSINANTKALGYSGCFIACNATAGNVIGWFCIAPGTWKEVSGV